MSRKANFVTTLDRFVSATLNKSSSVLSRMLMLVLLLGAASSASAGLTAEDITWGVKGLDSNDVSTGPSLYPVAARICTEGGDPATVATATFLWENDGFDTFFDDANPHAYINLRASTLDVITLDVPGNGGCADAYYEVEITRDSNAYNKTRQYVVDATSVLGNAQSESPREVFVEHLISQSRNSVDKMFFKKSTDPDAEYLNNEIAAGGTLTLAVGETYHIKLEATTATQGYEQLESFVNFPNIIFQTLAVSTTYSADTSANVPDPSDKLYGDGCIWDADVGSANYLSCTSTGKVGGTITTIYTVKILQIPGAPLVNPQPLSTLVHDFSGSSYHYNADFSASTRFAHIIGSTIEKSFVPKNIFPGGTSTLTFTITNPLSAAISDVSFFDNLPTATGVPASQMTIADTAVVTSSDCGTPTVTGLTIGSTSVSFTTISIPAFGTCTIDITVTSANVGIYDNETSNLLIGTFDTLSSGSDILVVTDLAPPPSSCGGNTETMAIWDMATTTVVLSNGVTFATASASNVAAIIDATDGNPANSYSLVDNWLTSSLDTTTLPAPAFPSTPYFEFEVDSSNHGGLEIFLDIKLDKSGDWAANNNQAHIYSSTDGVTYTFVSTTGIGKDSFGPASAINITNTGIPTTYFRVFVDAANSQKLPTKVLVDNVQIRGCPRLELLPTMAKSFSPDTIDLGGVSTLTFTFQNPNATPITEVSFSDTLPTGLVIADPETVTFPACTSGSIDVQGVVTADAFTRQIDMSGFALSANADCSFTVNVQGIVDGGYINTSSVITSGETGPNLVGGANVGYGQAPLTVNTVPLISKIFGETSILDGEQTTLTFNVSNTSTKGSTLTGVSFNDTLPLGVTYDSTNAVLSTCDDAPFNGSITSANSGIVSLSGVTLTAGTSCVVSVNVTGVVLPDITSPSQKTNTVTVLSDQGTGNTAEAILIVEEFTPGLAFTKKIAIAQSEADAGDGVNSLVSTSLFDIWYVFLFENTGTDDPNLAAMTDDVYPTADANMVCTSTGALPAPSDDPNNFDHFRICVFGPVPLTIGTVLNTAGITATGVNSGDPVAATDTAIYDVTPTAVTIGKVELNSVLASDFLSGLGAEEASTESLLALLTAWDADLAASLIDADNQTLLDALGSYLDPDGDEQLAVFRWDTLEERGTIGFYVERKQGNGEWIRINDSMLPGLITAPMGGEYQLADPEAQAGQSYLYRLIEQEARGTTQTYGPFTLEIE